MNRSESKQKRDKDRFDLLDKETIKKFYQDHTIVETMNEFHIGRKWLYKIVGEKRGYKKAKELAKARGHCHNNVEKGMLTKLERYGDSNYNNMSKHMQTRALNSGSIEESYANSLTKGQKTKKELYGDPYYNNPEKNRQTCLAKYGTDNSCKVPEIQRKSHIRYTYNKHYFDSSWELALWIYAIDHNEEISQANIRFEYVYNNVTYGYFPDFMYKGELIEIKGDHLKNGNIYDSSQNEKYLLKYKCAIDNGVKFFYYNDIKFALDYVYKTYGKNYMKQFRNSNLREGENKND